MKTIISTLSIFCSSFVYADLKLDESYSYPMLKEKIEFNHNLNIDELKNNDNFDFENMQKPYKEKDKCMTAICKKDIVSMSRSLKDYSDANIKPSNTGTTVEESFDAADKADKKIKERNEKEEKERKEKK